MISQLSRSAMKRWQWLMLIGSVALLVIAIIVDVTHLPPVIEADESAATTQLAPISVAVRDSAIAIQPETVIELTELLRSFIPVAQAHGLDFDPDLLTQLQRQADRLGINAPVSVTFEGDAGADYGQGIAAVYLPDDAAALAAELTGATEAWVATLESASAITRVSADQLNAEEPDATNIGARTAFAPASRSGARSGQPVNTTAVRQLSDDFDNWLANEAQAAYEAEAARVANFRARMVSLSRAAGNGRLPAEVLCPIPFSPRFTMRCDVIESLVELNDAFRAHFGRNLVVVSGYRGNPGTSNHGWGLAVDFGGQMSNFGTAEFNWMNANARRFGWGHAFWAVPGGLNPQPWHWEAMDQIREMTGSWR